ncbi:hypothetical protein [Paraburkholderia hiiakae]|nr:hypothetical protein [Paraburkholderia hiiakae]
MPASVHAGPGILMTGARHLSAPGYLFDTLHGQRVAAAWRARMPVRPRLSMFLAFS